MTRKEELKVLMDDIENKIRAKSQRVFFWSEIPASEREPEPKFIDVIESLVRQYRSYEMELELITHANDDDA